MSSCSRRLLCTGLRLATKPVSVPVRTPAIAFIVDNGIRQNRNTIQRARTITSEARAHSLHEKANADEISDITVEHHKERQKERPWHREGVDEAPVARNRSAGAMTKGKRDLEEA